MKRFLSAAGISLALMGSALAGSMTQGLEINGGENSFAALAINRAQTVVAEDGVLTLQISMSQAQKLKGYGFVLQYDPSKYEFVEAREMEGHLLNTGSGQPTLFLSSNKTPGQVAIGSMKIDGQAASGNGDLVAVSFRTKDTPLPTDFQVLEGVLVDMTGNIDAIRNVEIGNLKPIPTNYALGPNVPNPFNPSTNIAYQLPEAGDVSMIIYNLLGQQVRTLVKGAQEAGFQSVVWDGRDDFGRQVASGVYIYRLQAGNFSQAHRMMLLK